MRCGAACTDCRGSYARIVLAFGTTRGSAVKVDEIFGPTIQGEGALAGTVTMFVRLGGCDYRCIWCDTLHAVDPENAVRWAEMTPHDILVKVNQIAPQQRWGDWVTVSGGNPAIWQKELPTLVEELQIGGWRVNIETQGSVPNDAFKQANTVTLSPKGPSSGMKLDTDKLAQCVALAGKRAVFKFVVGGPPDMRFAMDIAQRHPEVPVYAQPVTVKGAFPYLATLCETVAQTPELSRWKVIPQLHVLAWGNERGR